jgi:cob(I)alamin adenosyltransferase
MAGLKKGLVEVYTGDGKGKTTAAFGLAFRALGWGMKVYILQFMKLGTYGENRLSRKIDGNLRVDYVGMPYFIGWEGEVPVEDKDRVKNLVICPRDHPPEEYRNKVQLYVKKLMDSWGDAVNDIVILDEINVALYYRLVDMDQVIFLMENRPDNVELVFTGRKMPEEITERADLITVMNEVRHPYSSGVPARRGVDF